MNPCFRRLGRAFGCWWMLSFWLSSALVAGAASPSKIAPHFIGDYTAGGTNIVLGKPRVIKVLAGDGYFPAGMIGAMRHYKATVPDGKVIVRVYSPTTYTLAQDATASAQHFWTNILQPTLNSLAPADRALIDYLEGPNEGQTPTLGYPWESALQASQWFNQFWTNLTPLIVSAGYKPCIGSIAVGNPGGDLAQHLGAFVPALRQAKAAGGAWSYHSYTINYTTDVAEERYYALRYRTHYEFFAAQYPDLVDIPLILTEGGVDFTGDPPTSGWQARGTAADYERWLNWFDARLQEDSYVMGCTLFQIGDSYWSSFNLEPIGGWLGNYLTLPATFPPAPTGLTADGSDGIRLSWSSVPLTPTTFNVKRSLTNGGPYITIATNVLEGVRAGTFTDWAVTNGQTYSYVLSALNAVGESTNSVSIAATAAYPKINIGGPAMGEFVVDHVLNGGELFTVTNAVATAGVSNSAPAAVYQTQRYGDMHCTLDRFLPRAPLKIRLHLAETYFGATNQRRFNVYANGALALTNYDIFAAAGGSLRAVVPEFNAVASPSGQLSLQFVSLVDNATVAGIEVVANSLTNVPAAPTNLTARIGPGSVILDWKAPDGATGFGVKRGYSFSGPFTVIASNLTAATFTDTSYTTVISNYYRVFAVNEAGTSPDSALVAAKPGTTLPDMVITSVSWSPVGIYPGNNVVFSAVVQNRGNAATPADQIIGVSFSLDGGPAVAWTSTATPLAAGASVTLTASSGPDGDAFWTATGSGLHTVSAFVDDINRFAEGNEDNNTLEMSVPVLTTGHRINAGGAAVGGFSADTNFNGSLNTAATTNAILIAGLTNPAPEAVYQSERWGAVTYSLGNLPPGQSYLVRLHFAEISPSVSAVGQRQFHVFINESQVLTNYDVLAAAGGKFRAVLPEFPAYADANGFITVRLAKGAANEPKLNGLEIQSAILPAISAIPAQTVAEGSLLQLTMHGYDADPGTAIMDFESYSTNAFEIMFRLPNFSPTTASKLETSPNWVQVTGGNPGYNLAMGNGSTRALYAEWSFKADLTNAWLRFTTFNANGKPNPTVDFGQAVRLQLWTSRNLRLGLGLRETGTSAAIGADGGGTGTIEHAGVTTNSGGVPQAWREIVASNWTTVQFNLPSENLTAFPGSGNGVLTSATGKGVLEHLVIIPTTGNGYHNIMADNFAVLPTCTFTYALLEAPAGASVNATNGVFSWIPSETQGGSNYPVTVRVVKNGDARFSATRSFTVSVTESNQPPVLASLPPQFVNAGATLLFTNAATDADLPANTLTYSLDAGFPAGASIGAGSGIFQWTAPAVTNLQTNLVTIRVTDNGVAPQSAAQTVMLVVVPQPKLAEVSLTNGQFALRWTGYTNRSYQVQWKANLTDPVWMDLGGLRAGTNGTLSFLDNVTETQRFYRIVQQP